MGNYIADSPWNTGNIYLITLGELLRAAQEARVANNAKAWLTILEGICGDYSPLWTQEEIDNITKELDEINDILYQKEAGSYARYTETERLNMAWEKLKKTHPLIVRALYDHSLLAPKGIDPNHAVAYGGRY